MESNASLPESSLANDPLLPQELRPTERLLAQHANLPAVSNSLRRNVLGAASRAAAARSAWKWRALGLLAAGGLLCGTFWRIALLESRRLEDQRLQQIQNNLNNPFQQPVLPPPTFPSPPVDDNSQSPGLQSPPFATPVPAGNGPGRKSPDADTPGNLVDQPASEAAPARPAPPATPDPARSEIVPDEVPQPVDPRQGPLLGQFETDTDRLEEAFRQRREKLALMTLAR